MKKLILLINFVSLCALMHSQDQIIKEKSQSKNEIGIYSRIGICELTRHQEQQGIASAHGKEVLQYGLSYIRTISKDVKLETGVFYSRYTIVNHIIDEPDLHFYATEYMHLISIPILFRYYFQGNIYVSGGTTLDLVSSRTGGWVLTDSQNGFSLSIGAGKEIFVNRISFYFEPNFILHAVVPFSGNLIQQKFFVPGFKLGINYNI
jgi:hypothetical protein